jgi:hypothetical protein
VIGVNSKQDFIDSLKVVNENTKYFGGVAEISIFAHGGSEGPVFPGSKSAGPLDRQFETWEGGIDYKIDMKQLQALHVNWATNGWAGIFTCRGKAFADAFGQAQGVAAFGYSGKTSFYSDPRGRWFDKKNLSPSYRGPLYLRPQ